MIRVAVIASDPSAVRGVLDELAVCSGVFHPFAVPHSEVATEILRNSADVFLLDVQSVFQIDAQALTNAICFGRAKGGFICCCSGCPIDRERIFTIEEAGADWCPLPASGVELTAFIRKVHDRLYRDEIANAPFLAALWELVAEDESRRDVPRTAPTETRDSEVRNPGPNWMAMLTDILARIIRQRPRVSGV